MTKCKFCAIGLRGTGGAFTSYVRRRGEPDGRTSSQAEPSINGKLMSVAGIGGLTNVKVTRPGGGGESDAAFTPSPPVCVPLDAPVVATLTLAHQSRIRNLYPPENSSEGKRNHHSQPFS